MSRKDSGMYVRPPADGDPPRNDQGATRLFPAPARAAGGAARRPESNGVSVRATLGVDAAEATPRAAAPAAVDGSALGEAEPDGGARKGSGAVGSQPARPARKPPRAANEPTQVFVLSPSAADADLQKSSAPSRRTDGAAVPFSPVPNGVSVAGAPLSARAAAAPRSAAAANEKGSPLLRAFDQRRPRAATWWMAKTMTVATTEVAAAERSTQASASTPVGSRRRPRSQPKQRFASLQKLLVGLRSTASARKKLMAIVAAAAMLMGGVGTLVGRSIASQSTWTRAASPIVSARAAAPADAADAADAKGLDAVPSRAVTSYAVPPHALPAHAEPPPDMPARDEAPRVESAGGDAPPVEAARDDVARDEAPRDEALRAEAPSRRSQPATTTPSVGSAPRGLTLARQAVDALLAGDRPRALQLYRELSRKAPGHDGYREAIRLLSKDVPSSPSRPRSP